jgi:hypothetical protein
MLRSAESCSNLKHCCIGQLLILTRINPNHAEDYHAASPSLRARCDLLEIIVASCHQQEDVIVAAHVSCSIELDRKGKGLSDSAGVRIRMESNI